MKETFYFSHDYNAIQDPKMMALLNCCGLSGIGMYWIIIELLHQQPNNKLLYKSYENYIDFYGRLDGENEQVLNKIKQVLISTELFINEDDFIYSNRVLENKRQREIISEKRSFAGKMSAEARKSTNVEQVLNTCQQGKERKGKENKVIINNSDKSPSSKSDLTQTWQYEALECIKILKATKSSSIFKCFKDNRQRANTALNDCKELGHLQEDYFFKVYNELIKK